MNTFFINTTEKLNLKSFKNSSDFNFRQVSLKEVKSEILDLHIKTSSIKGSIPATILKQCVDIYLPFLTNAINRSILDNYFPKELKKAEIIPVYKKDDSLKKENYRPVCLLSHVSKIFERLIYKQ